MSPMGQDLAKGSSQALQRRLRSICSVLPVRTPADSRETSGRTESPTDARLKANCYA
jgi:hypothetical protein